ncbi:condensation domain-containing protein [Micromonospora sp. WMMD987]|uniref:condensation domain-containing protein n=1 Tax=Micromonospora sp. WMMD987 TaxID=3016089 RepID=UPI00249C0941|nr:condensation domain-containing protein [Micromonospora sp. WMMD987]WFE95314.1 condensation domain-containing protein [Micromonospora sp. WMMD987]
MTDTSTNRVRIVADAVLNGTTPVDGSLERIGLTSLERLELCRELERRTGVTVSLADAMTATTTTALATRYRNGGTPGRSTPARGGIPLTSLARGCLLRQLISPSDVAGNCLLLWALDGPVEVDLLAGALIDLQERHESLRSSYSLRGGAELARPPSVPARTAADTLEQALARCRQMLGVPLHPTAGDVFRSVIIGTPTGVVLGVVAHHVAFDGYSESVLAADLSRAYRARLTGRAVDWPAAPDARTASASYRGQRAAADLDQQRARVRAALSGVVELHLPGAVRRVSGREPAAPRVLSTGLAPVPTSFAAMAAAYARAVHTLTGVRDVAFAVPVNRRAAAGLDTVIGNFVEMLPVRILLPIRPDADADLTATAVAWTGALGGLDLEFEEVVRAVRAARHVYQHVFAVQNNPAPRLELPRVRARLIRAHYPGLANRSMTEVWPAGTGYSDTADTAVLTYGEGWVGEAEAAQLLTAFRTNLDRYLRQAAADPGVVATGVAPR